MMNAAALVDALKRTLKAEGLSYGALAARIGMSEASNWPRPAAARRS